MQDMEKLMNTDALEIKPQDIFEFNAKALQTPGVINMTVGEPNFATPDHIKQAAIDCIKNRPIHYTVPQGIPEMLAAEANFLKKKYDVDYDPKSEIVSSVGVTEGVYTTFKAILNPGDEVLIPTPSFTIYGPNAILNGAKPIYMDTSKNDFKIDPKELDQILASHPKIKAIIFNYPTNPTGVTYDYDELKAFADVFKKYPIFVISDEIYSELSYSHKHICFAKLLPDQTILLNGVSKSHAMTGWRVGFICAPKKIAQHILHVHELVTTSIPTVSQVAADEALKNGMDDTKPMAEQYIQRRDALYDGLTKIGFKVVKPQGAFYIFAKIPANLEQNDLKFAEDLIAKEKLSILPGRFFGAGGEGHLRISYAASMDNIHETIKRLTDYIQNYSK